MSLQRGSANIESDAVFCTAVSALDATSDLNALFDHISDEVLADLAHWDENVERINDREAILTVADQEQLPELNNWLVEQGLRVYEMAPHRFSLEELFVQIMQNQEIPA